MRVPEGGQRVQDGDAVPDLRQSALAAALDDARRLPDLLHVLHGQVEQSASVHALGHGRLLDLARVLARLLIIIFVVDARQVLVRDAGEELAHVLLGPREEPVLARHLLGEARHRVGVVAPVPGPRARRSRRRRVPHDLARRHARHDGLDALVVQLALLVALDELLRQPALAVEQLLHGRVELLLAVQLRGQLPLDLDHDVVVVAPRRRPFHGRRRRRPRPPLLVIVAVVVRVAVLDDVRPGVVRLAQARHEVVAVLGPHAVSSILFAPVAVLAARRVAGHEEVVVLVVAHGYGFGRWGCPRRVARDCKTAGVPFVVASPARDGGPLGRVRAAAERFPAFSATGHTPTRSECDRLRSHMCPGPRRHAGLLCARLCASSRHILRILRTCYTRGHLYGPRTERPAVIHRWPRMSRRPIPLACGDRPRCVRGLTPGTRRSGR